MMCKVSSRRCPSLNKLICLSSNLECVETVVKQEGDIVDDEPPGPFEIVTSKAHSEQTAAKSHNYHQKFTEVVVKVERDTSDADPPKSFAGDRQADCETPQAKRMVDTRHNNHYQEGAEVVVKMEYDSEGGGGQKLRSETATGTLTVVEEVPIEWEAKDILNKEETKIIPQLLSPKTATERQPSSSNRFTTPTHPHYRRSGRPMGSQQFESFNSSFVSHVRCDLSYRETSTIQKSKIEPCVEEKPKKKVFNCQHCEYSASNKRYLQTHMRTHTGERPYKCEICDYSATEQGNLQRHMRTHTGEKPFKCEHCDYSGSQHTALQMHRRRHLGDKRYRCAHCDYSTYGTSILQRHMRVHTGEKPFKCELCDYRTSQCSTLQTHMRTHTGEKPFKCDRCDYSASQHSTLKKHIRVHTKEKPFKCDICDYSAALRSTLQKHMKCTHGINTNNKIDPLKI